jgi:hypothetical protein
MVASVDTSRFPVVSFHSLIVVGVSVEVIGLQVPVVQLFYNVNHDIFLLLPLE